jgi:hypothetical protein
MPHQVHTCFGIDVARISLLQDNVEALDINGQQFRVQWTEYQAKLGDCVAYMIVMVIRVGGCVGIIYRTYPLDLVLANQYLGPC